MRETGGTRDVEKGKLHVSEALWRWWAKRIHSMYLNKLKHLMKETDEESVSSDERNRF